MGKINLFNKKLNKFEIINNKLIINMSLIDYKEESIKQDNIIEVKIKDIPDFLHNSELYKSLIENDPEGTFEISSNNYKNNLIIKNINCFYHLLSTLKFWLVIDVPWIIYDCIIINKSILQKDFNENMFENFDFFEEFKILLKFKDNELINECARMGFLNLIKYLRSKNYKWNTQTCINAASNGHLDCLKYAHENGRPLYNFKKTRKCNWRCYLRYRPHHHRLRQYNICEIAASNGHLDCLKYAHEKGCPLYNSNNIK
jgi:hypothetical protein